MAEDEKAADWLPDEAVVVRGGQMDPQVTKRALRKEQVEHGQNALSVYSIPGLDAHQIAAQSGTEALPHPEIRESTVEALKNAGYEIRVSEQGEGHAEGHCDLIVPWEPSNEDCERLQQLFGEKSPNPVKRDKRG